MNIQLKSTCPHKKILNYNICAPLSTYQFLKNINPFIDVEECNCSNQLKTELKELDIQSLRNHLLLWYISSEGYIYHRDWFDIILDSTEYIVKPINWPSINRNHILLIGKELVGYNKTEYTIDIDINKQKNKTFRLLNKYLEYISKHDVSRKLDYLNLRI